MRDHVERDLRAAFIATVRATRRDSVTAWLRGLTRRSADITSRLSATTCSQGSGQGCASYHGLWPYLKMARLVADPVSHRGFYRDAITMAMETRLRGRILISGTADFTMLALVLDVTRKRRQYWNVDVLDSCMTPLLLSDWFAKSAGREMMSAQSDVLAFSPTRTYDLILSDSFLNRFTPPAQTAVLSKWRSLLRPGGRVATTVRLEGRTPVRRSGDLTLADRDAFMRTARLQFSKMFPKGPLRDALACQAMQYIRDVRVHPMGFRDDVVSHFQDCGLAVSGFREMSIASRRQSMYAQVTAGSDGSHQRNAA